MAATPANTFFGSHAVPVVNILGCNVSSVTVFEALATMELWIAQNSPHCRFVVATGFHGVWEAQKNVAFMDILNSADLFCADGIAPVWLSKLLGEPLVGRVPGPDLLAAFISVANIKSYSSFFLGDTPDTLAALSATISQRYPKHRIAGMLSPPFRRLTHKDNLAILDSIHEAKPDVLWVAFGLPKQELWIFEHLKDLKVPVAVAVGAAFGFMSGKVKRAPGWMGGAGFEWLWRLAHEPRKLWHRDFVEGPKFLAHAIRACLRSRAEHRARNGRLSG
jgi:N-acetylglucosaminyldiphosphoundecaprenol N-acetyl-beta-D-mannosaminyltransferase